MLFINPFIYCCTLALSQGATRTGTLSTTVEEGRNTMAGHGATNDMKVKNASTSIDWHSGGRKEEGERHDETRGLCEGEEQNESKKK